MSNAVELNRSLDEDARQAYLAAMQVAQWVPVADNNQLEAIHELQSEKAQQQAALDEINETANVTAAEKIQEKAVLAQEQAPVLNIKETDSAVAEIENISEEDSLEQVNAESSTAGNSSSSHFLEMVNWTNTVLSEENAKTLLIICRHQVDQPANSFARSNSPSQFMTDFISALNNFSCHQNTEYKVQLAHLSAAGLSEDCIPLTRAIQLNKPTATLLLGDETVTHLLGESHSVANARGLVHKLPDGTRALVSYHPFSLIQNPSLKRLAFEDLVLASEILSQ